MAYSANIDEINGVLSSGVLTTLQNDSEESVATIGTINGFIDGSNNVLVGEMWDVERQKLQRYNELLTQRANVEMQLQTALTEALQLIKDYMGDDADLDSAKLPELKNTVKQIERQIANIQAMMRETKTVDTYDDEGKWTGSYEVPAHDNAALQQQINELQPVLDEANRLVEKIEGLQAIMDRSQAIIDQAYSQLQQYEKAVDNVENTGNIWATIAVGGINFLGGAGKTVENVVDGILWTGGGALFTIGDWLGFNTDNARRNLASTIGTDVVGGAVSTIFEETAWGSSLNANSYYSYDSDAMQTIYDTTNGAVTFMAEAVLPTPVAVAFGAMHNAGAKAEELYASDPDALGGLGGDYGWRITASGVEGGINGYLSNNAVKEIKGLASHGFGHFDEASGFVRQYRGMRDFMSTNSSDIIVETGIDAISNIAGDFADKGNLTPTDILMDVGQAVGEQALALGPTSTNFAQVASPALDVLQGTGLDDTIINTLNNQNGSSN